MKKFLSFILMTVFALSIAGIAYAEEICPKPPQLFCAEGQVVGMFKDDSGCLITMCVDKTENTVYCWNDATCVNGATWMNANRCAVDSDCVCGGMDLNSGKCYVGNKEYYNVNVDKTKDCSDYCRLDERLVKCVKNWCTLVSATDTTADANLSPATCVTNKNGSCCIGNVCKTTINGCSQGFMTNFFGCSDTCTPKFECLLNTTKNCIMEGYQTQDTNPAVSCCEGLVPRTSPELVGRATCVKSGTASGDKPIVSVQPTMTPTATPGATSGEKPIVSTITSVNNCPTPTTPLCTEGKVLGVFKNDNGCPIFKCVDVSANNPMVTAAAFPAVCFDESLNRQVLEINKRLGELKDDAQIAELKTKLENINAEILQKKDECAQKKQYKQEQQYAQETTTAQTAPRGVAVGQVCEVSEDLRVKQDGVWKVYKEAIENGDDAAIAFAKTALETIRTEIQSARQACMDTVVPGQIKNGGGQGKIVDCKIPQELYDKLENLWKKAREISGDAIAPADIKEQITQVEEKIRAAKATCNAAVITSTTNSQDLADGYKERIASAISSTDGLEAKIQSLKELRKEIDETIKNLIKEQKKFKFNEFKDLTDDVTISPGSVEIGDSKTESKDVEIETEIEGDNITVSTSDDFVLLEDSGLIVEASSVDISSDGITVDGTTLKVSPKKLLTRSKGLEQYKANAKVKIEKIKGKVQYRAEYQSQKKLFGFISVTADNAVEVDAVSGEVTSKESPWWNGLAADAAPVKTEAIAEVATG
ncbi:MAG: hypothetical protein V1837_08025 [Candidatus Woesearchaeota archaeon]